MSSEHETPQDLHCIGEMSWEHRVPSQLHIVGENLASEMVSKGLGQGSYRSVNSITCGMGEGMRAIQPEEEHLNRASF